MTALRRSSPPHTTPLFEKEGGLKLYWHVISVEDVLTCEDVKMSEKSFFQKPLSNWNLDSD